MKTQSKSSNKTVKAKGGSQGTPETNRPNVGTTKIQKKKIDYSSMWEAIQKIAQPISFKSLKRFYNMK